MQTKHLHDLPKWSSFNISVVIIIVHRQNTFLVGNRFKDKIMKLCKHSREEHFWYFAIKL